MADEKAVRDVKELVHSASLFQMGGGGRVDSAFLTGIHVALTLMQQDPERARRVLAAMEEMLPSLREMEDSPSVFLGDVPRDGS